MGQNKALLCYSTLSFLAFIICCSVVGIAVPPVIPLANMLFTTTLITFNSYRVSFAVDCELDKKVSWLKAYLASDWSIGLITGSSLFLLVGVF